MSDEVNKVIAEVKDIVLQFEMDGATAMAVLQIAELRRIADALEAAREDGPR